MEVYLDTAYVHLTLRNGILIGTYKKDLQIDLPIAREIVRSRIDFTRGKTYPALIYNKGIISIDKASRDFFASEEGILGLKAAAIVLDSPFSTFLGNFFLLVNKTSIPVKIFSNDRQGFNWLEKFVSAEIKAECFG
jgi:hypothetical protein